MHGDIGAYRVKARRDWDETMRSLSLHARRTVREKNKLPQTTSSLTYHFRFLQFCVTYDRKGLVNRQK